MIIYCRHTFNRNEKKVFVSLKNRAMRALVTCAASAALLTACSNAEDPRAHYVRENWPHTQADGALSMRGDQLCIDVMACVDFDKAVVQATTFAANNVTFGLPTTQSKTDQELREWRMRAVANACFIDSWEAYMGTALLWFMYQDAGDEKDFITQFAGTDFCKNAVTLNKPQP